MSEEKFEISSGNIFKDLGFPNPELEQLKTSLSFQIYTILKERKLNRKTVAKMLEIDESQAAMLCRGDLPDCSVDELFTYLNRLHFSVEVRLIPSPEGEAFQRLVALS
ncbi:XRE family transcriptional regulator [Candidatus Poribacteria bacterium]|nr:XRE family transcriptional regulator [Candidatus Poribacteria bacterium]